MSRADPSGSRLTEPRRDVRVAVQLVYTTGSVYMTNRSTITNVPGTALLGVLKEVSSSTQRLLPTEGRTMVGSLDFTCVDIDGDITDAIRDQIFDEDEGVGREVRLFTGDTDDFTDGTWRRVATYFVDGDVELSGFRYRFSCSDLNRYLRTDVFDFKRTRLAATLEVDATSMVVVEASDFELVEHTASFTESPLQTIGYVKLEQSGEIISWSSKVDNGNGTWTLQGLRREIANSRAVRVEVDGTSSEQWPEVQEYIYLELPAVAMDHAVRTGTILGTSITLPAHWTAGVSTSWVEADSWTNIGTDIYDPANPDGGLVLRFIGLERTDAKRWLEEQVLRPMWCTTMVTPEGKWRLKRVTSVLGTASTLRTLTENRDFIGPVTIRHELRELVNQLLIDWNFNGTKLTRPNVLLNVGSQEREQRIGTKRLELYGLTVNRHQTSAVITKLMDGYTDRFGSPPIRFRGRLSRRHNDLEIGDVVRVQLPSVRDYSGAATFDRACEVQEMSVNWMTGEVMAEFFASTTRTNPWVPLDDLTPIGDAWWSSEGTRIDSALTVVSNEITSTGTLTGAADMRDPSAIYYWEGTLTLNAGVQVNWTQNVQLRVKHLVINGRLDGVGRGIAAVADPNTVGAAIVVPSQWTQPTVGVTRGGGGIWYVNGGNLYVGQGQPVTQRGNESLPRLQLAVENGVLTGIPAEARGTPGQYGGPVYSSDTIVRGNGGVGGAGGAGLCIVFESLSFGVNGVIDTSGEAGATGQAGDVSHGGNTLRPGTGGGGAAGGLYLIGADRGTLYPDVEGHFVADHGATVVSGNPIGFIPPDAAPAAPWTGSVPGVGAEDNWEASHLFQYVPLDETLGEGPLERPPIPAITSAVATDAGILVTFDGLPESGYGVVQLFSSITNDLSDAVKVADIRAPYFHHVFDGIQTRYYWARVIDGGVKGDFSSGQLEGFIATGGSSNAVVEWVETFEPYTSREDFERNYVVSGNPTITFPSNGVNGGKTMLVTGYMHAVAKKNYPYDPRKMYEAEVRLRKSVGQAGVEAATIGFLGVKPDGVTLIDRFGTSFDSSGNRSILSAFDMGLLTAGEWRRMSSWVQGSANSSSFTDAPPGLATVDRLMANPVQLRAAADGTKAAYVRPFIQVGSPSATTGAVEIDHISLVRPVRPGPSVPNVEDANFGISLESDYWLSDESSGLAPVQFVTAEGVNGGNAAFWNVTGPMAFLWHRQVFPVSDVLKTTLTYRIVNLSSMNASTTLHVGLQGRRINSTAASIGLNVYQVGGGSSGTTPSATVAMNTLTADGNWNNVALSLTNLFADAHLDGADYMRLFIWVATVGTNDFDFYVGRVNAVRS